MIGLRKVCQQSMSINHSINNIETISQKPICNFHYTYLKYTRITNRDIALSLTDSVYEEFAFSREVIVDDII